MLRAYYRFWVLCFIDILVCCSFSTHPAVCGKKWSKRAIGMTAPTEQLQFVWLAARCLSLCAKPNPTDPTVTAQLAQDKAEALEKLLKLRADIVEALPDAAAGHFDIREQELKQMAEEAAAWGAAGGSDGAAVNAISLDSVGDALEVRETCMRCRVPAHFRTSERCLHCCMLTMHCPAQTGVSSECVTINMQTCMHEPATNVVFCPAFLQKDAVWEDWLHTVMDLLQGFPVSVQLPLDQFSSQTSWTPGLQSWRAWATIASLLQSS